jgi:hypothetical protein
MTTVRAALEAAMRHANPDEAVSALSEEGVAVATQDTMSQAIHDVYCGIMADHDHPNEKDQDQARQVLAALGRLSEA